MGRTLAMLGAVALACAALAERPTPLRGQEPAPTGYRVNVNTAPWWELALLPSVGAKLAQRIVEQRDQMGRFDQLDQLDAVPGMGPKTVSRLRRFAEAGEVEP